MKTPVAVGVLTGLAWLALAAISERSAAHPLPSEATTPAAHEPGRRSDGPSSVADPPRPEMKILVRLHPELRQPGDRGDVIRVWLDPARLRAHNLAGDDVMKAFVESNVLGSPRRVDPPPWVVFVTRLWRPDQYENLIVKANAEGDIVRLKDIAKVEIDR